MKASAENLAYLQKSLGRKLDDKTVVKISVAELSKLIEGVRKKERAKEKPSEFTKIVDVLFNGRAA